MWLKKPDEDLWKFIKVIVMALALISLFWFEDIGYGSCDSRSFFDLAIFHQTVSGALLIP